MFLVATCCDSLVVTLQENFRSFFHEKFTLFIHILRRRTFLSIYSDHLMYCVVLFTEKVRNLFFLLLIREAFESTFYLECKTSVSKKHSVMKLGKKEAIHSEKLRRKKTACDALPFFAPIIPICVRISQHISLIIKLFWILHLEKRIQKV